MKQEEYMDELIALVLAGEADAEAIQKLESWKLENPENKKYYEQMAMVFQRSEAAKTTLNYNTDKAWVKVKAKTISKTQEPQTKVRTLVPRWLNIAAGIALIAGLSWFLFIQGNQNTSQNNIPIVIASKDSIVQQQLGDGTEITLNKNAHLIYDGEYNQKERKVKLSGEAYFKVKHLNERPFSVWIDELQVLDIGTEFNIKAYPQSDSVIVDVNEGEVQLNVGQKEPLRLTKGERGIYSKKEKSMKKFLSTDRNSLAWKNKIFVFDNTELHTVVTMLNDLYPVQIILENRDLEKCRLNAQFNNESIEEIIEVIAATFNLKVTKTERSVLLDGKSCGLE